jgi:hypothetical protein
MNTDAAPADTHHPADRLAARRIRHAWWTGLLHATGSAALLLATGHNVVLAAHYPLVSALAILLLAFGVRHGSRVAAFLLCAAVLTPALIKLIIGALHVADLPAFPLAALYFRGFIGTLHGAQARTARPRIGV